MKINTIALWAFISIIFALLTGCSDSKSFDINKNITVISREEGSGTRGAFVELLGIDETTSEGKKKDNTVKTSDITQSTGVMLTNVEQNKYAIGYISVGSLNDNVKALKIDGIEPTMDNVKNGRYDISRPFNIVVKPNLSPEASDFISFIMSAEGQEVVRKNGCVDVTDNPPAYSSNKPTGKITISGSSSVAPVIEKLKEAYEEINPDVNIELNQSDSSMGISNTVDGICDIGMASREINDSELQSGIDCLTIATDGLVLIINKENPVMSLSKEQIHSIYTGESVKWSDLNA